MFKRRDGEKEKGKKKTKLDALTFSGNEAQFKKLQLAVGLITGNGRLQQFSEL